MASDSENVLSCQVASRSIRVKLGEGKGAGEVCDYPWDSIKAGWRSTVKGLSYCLELISSLAWATSSLTY